MKRFSALLAAGAAILVSAPSLAVTVTTTFDLAGATKTGNGNQVVIGQTGTLAQNVTVATGSQLDFTINFLQGQSITLNGKISLKEILTAVTGSAAYAVEKGTLYLKGTAVSITKDDGAGNPTAEFGPNYIGQFDSAINEDFDYSATESLTITGLEWIGTISGYEDANGNPLNIASRDYNSPAFSLTADSGSINLPAVPEPASWALMVGGFGLVGAAMRRKQVKVAFGA